MARIHHFPPRLWLLYLQGRLSPVQLLTLYKLLKPADNSHQEPSVA